VFSDQGLIDVIDVRRRSDATRCDGRPARPATEEPSAPGGTSGQATGPSSFLDEEPPQVDGVEAGARAAAGYRSPGSGGTSQFGTSRRHEARPLSPRPRIPIEAPAIATLRHIISAEEAFKKQTGRYGTLAEMAAGHTLFVDEPLQGGGFRRKGYKFELQLTGDGFRAMALPQMAGPRSFVGEDSGYISEE
jgi:hypothetical protein